MKGFLKAFSLLALITFFASCKKDDDVAPPRDYGVQYAAEKIQIEEYLKTHVILGVDADYNVTIGDLLTPDQVSIWDQTQYPLQHKTIYSLVSGNTPEYTIYYLNIRQGTGDRPTRADNVRVAYTGTLLDGTQFDTNPYPQEMMALYGLIEGWQEIIPLFNAGTYNGSSDSPDPAVYDNYGVGVMFLPSGLAYYNGGSTNVGSYNPLVFTFKLLTVEYTDVDNDGVENRYETAVDPATGLDIDVAHYDTDGDDTANYLDTDDDDDTFHTLQEVTKLDSNPVQYYTFEAIPTCEGGTVKKHLDPACH